MIIQNKKFKRDPLKQIIGRLRKKKSIALFFVLFLLSFFGIGCIYFGAYLNKQMNDTGQKDLLKVLVANVSNFDFAFVSKHVESYSADVDQFAIDVKFKNWAKIRYFREIGLRNPGVGAITTEMQEKVPAKIRYSNQTYRVNISLTGYMASHIKHPYKWSLSVEVKDDQTIKGMKRFALLFPESRGYLTDWIASQILKDNNVIGIRSDFVEVAVNGKDQGLYYLEERFDKRLIENNHLREGLIFKLDNNQLKVYDEKKVNENKELFDQLVRLRQLIYGFLEGKVNAEQIFDLEKYATLFVVSDLMNEKHALFLANTRLYFNPISSLIEPIGREWGYMNEVTHADKKVSLSIEEPVDNYHKAIHADVVLGKIVDSHTFKEAYLKKANMISSRSYLE